MVTETVKPTEIAAFDDYLRYGTDEERPKGVTSRRAYCWTVERFLRFLVGREPAPELAKEFIKDLEEQGNSPSSINRHIWALKSYFRFRIESGIPDVKELRIRGLTTKKHLPRFLSDREWEKLLKTATTPVYDPEISSYGRLRAKMELALLMAYCGGGLRCKEAVNLELDDVLDEGFLRVTRKGAKEGFVPIEDEVLRVIKDWTSVKPSNGRFVFPGKEEDSPMAPRTAQTIIKNLCRQAGLPDVHVHSLRHTAGFQLTRGGAPIELVQEFLGHENVQTTKLYAHMLSEQLRRRLPKRFPSTRQGRLDWQ